MTAPQPSRNAREMTFRFVPGGPEPMTKGLGNFRPSTVVASVGMVPPGFCGTSCLTGPGQKLDRIFVADVAGRPQKPNPVTPQYPPIFPWHLPRDLPRPPPL